MEHLIEKALEQLSKQYGFSVDVACVLFKDRLAEMVASGRLDLSTLGLRERCTLRKYDHSGEGGPEFVEEIVIENNERRIVRTEGR